MTRKKIKVLIVGAYAGELKPFLDMGKRYQHVENDIGFLSAGIGPVAASFGLTHFLEDYRPKTILAVGTAGIVQSEKLSLGDIVRVETLSYEGRGGFDKNSEVYVPDLQLSHVELKNSHEAFSHLQTVSVFAPQEISRGEFWSQHLSQHNYQVEHLESFAYAFVAQKFKIPLTILLGLTNHIGKTAHEEWCTHEKAVMEKLAGLVKSRLSL